MCYSPIRVLNPAFRSEKFKGNRRRPCPDPDNFPERMYRAPLEDAVRDLSKADFITESTRRYISVPCGWCAACRRARGSAWRFRLVQDLTHASVGSTCIFVTLTFATRHYGGRDAAVEKCGKRIRAFLDRWRKLYDKAPRHWFVTELGEKKGRFHIHGFIWDAPFYVSAEQDPYRSLTRMNRVLRKLWKYGGTHVEYVVPKHVNYCVKYVTKPCEYDKLFRSRIYCSRGIGSFMDEECVYEFYDKNVEGHYKIDFFGKPCSVPKYYQDRAFRRSAKEHHEDVASILQFRRYVSIRAPETIPTVDGIHFSDREHYDRYMESCMRHSFDLGLYPDYLKRRLFSDCRNNISLEDRVQFLTSIRDLSDIDAMFNQ